MYRALTTCIVVSTSMKALGGGRGGEQPLLSYVYGKCDCRLYQEGLFRIRQSIFMSIIQKHSGSLRFGFLSLLLYLRLPSFDNEVKAFDDALK